MRTDPTGRTTRSARSARLTERLLGSGRVIRPELVDQPAGEPEVAGGSELTKTGLGVVADVEGVYEGDQLIPSDAASAGQGLTMIVPIMLAGWYVHR